MISAVFAIVRELLNLFALLPGKPLSNCVYVVVALVNFPCRPYPYQQAG